MRSLAACALFSLAVTGASLQSLRAAVITPITSCSIDGVDAVCGDTDSVAGTEFSITGLGTSMISVLAAATAEAGLRGNFEANAAIIVSFLVTTPGPLRMGLVSYSGGADVEYGGFDSFADAFLSVEGLGSCSSPLCHLTGTMEHFQLGAPFLIEMSVSGYGSALEAPSAGGGGVSAIELMLTESSGDPVPIQLVVVPEPATLGTILISAIFAVPFARRLTARRS